jgi:hypothetical protein
VSGPQWVCMDQVVAGQVGLMSLARKERKIFLILLICFPLNTENRIKSRKYLGVSETFANFLGID